MNPDMKDVVWRTSGVWAIVFSNKGPGFNVQLTETEYKKFFLTNVGPCMLNCHASEVSEFWVKA